MADYGFADSFRLIFRCSVVTEEVQGLECAVVFEGHVRTMCVLIRRS